MTSQMCDTHKVDDFDLLTEAVRTRFNNEQKGSDLFLVNAEGLYDAYIQNLAVDVQREHQCSCCATFIKRYGSLATISKTGKVVSALWDPEFVPEMYKASVEAMAKLVNEAEVDAQHFTKNRVWGKPETGNWTHFSLEQPAKKQNFKFAGRAMAESRQKHKMLMAGLSKFNPDLARQALNLLESGAMKREEKMLGSAKFLVKVYGDLPKHEGNAYTNTVWRHITNAPVGWCKPQGTMIGTIMSDIAKGKSASKIIKGSDEKMGGLQYQRRQAPPKAGNIASGEKLVQEMGIELSLQRRFAKIEDVKCIWIPRPRAGQKPSGAGVFGHLQPKVEPTQRRDEPVAPLVSITFEKFRRTVLPKAIKMEVFTGSDIGLRAIVVAEHPDAPPILQWDIEGARNHASTYIYPGTNTPDMWCLPRHQYVEVTGVTLNPPHWHDETAFEHHAKRAIFLLKDAKDSRKGGLALFPEILKSELKPIASTIEAYSQNGSLENSEEASAIGMWVGDKTRPNRVRVTTEMGVAIYNIERFD